ncbi:hypothetical protein ACOWPX_29765 [Pseudomonas aeruginosa]|uniref:hypothetical protein n=1 Tax=Pseudomonas aeruginosa TaxID=287 RepID=UPI003BA9E764
MSDVIDVQTAVIGQLLDLLAAVPVFGDTVREDWVAGVLDAEDGAEPERLIILQEGDTVERDRSPGSVVEEWTVNIVPMARGRDAVQALREARLAIKRVLKGHKAGLTVPGLVRVDFPASAVRLPEPGRRWAYRAIPLQVSYSQQL